MIKLGLSKYDYSLLWEKWKIKVVYPEETAKKVREEFERVVENFFLEKKGAPKTVRIQFYELGTGYKCWVETFSTFQFNFQSHGVYGRQGILTLKVEAIIDNGCHVNISPQEV